MKPILYLYPTQLNRHRLPLLILLFWSILMATGLFGQSDRPCAAPLIAADQCNYSTPVLFSNTSFQADAPISCPGNFTRDGWFRFVAPATSVTISRSVYCRGLSNCTLPGTPNDIALALYQGTCNSLTVVDDCPAECFIGLGCIEALPAFGEAFALGDHFFGLNVGQEYFLRVLWDSTSASPPDTVIVNIVNDTPCNLCLSCGLGFTPVILAEGGIQLQASESGNAVQLEWESSLPTAPLQKMEIFRSMATSPGNWKLIGTKQYQAEKSTQFFIDLNPPLENAFLYRVSISDPDGNRQFSNAVQVRKSDNSINFSWHAQPNGYQLQLLAPSTGELTMINLNGQQVATHQFYSGYQEFLWSKSMLPSGIYMLQAQTSTQTQILKVRVH